MIPHDWTPLESTKIAKVKFDQNPHDARGDLHVEFKSGHVYTYKDVPMHKVEKLVHSSSSGSYFHNFIRDEHDAVKQEVQE